MRTNPSEFRSRFQRWKNGEQVYENGRALPAYEEGTAPYINRLVDQVVNSTGMYNTARYNANEDLYEANKRYSVTVTGKKPNTYKWVSPKTNQLNYGDLEKAYTAVTAGLFPNVLTAARNFSQGDLQKGFVNLGWTNDVQHGPDGTTYAVVSPGILGDAAKETKFLEGVKRGLYDAFAYKHSKQYEQLANEFRKTLRERGISPHQQTFRPVPQTEYPTIILQKKEMGKLGSYDELTNQLELDPDQLLPTEYINVPYHEGLHWQRIGHADSPLDRAYGKALQLYDRGMITEAQKDAMFDKWYNSTFFDDKAIKDFYSDLAEDAILPNASDYFIKNPQELLVHGLEAGRHVGIQPFQVRPSQQEVYKAFEKAASYDSFLYSIKDTPKNIWNILSGQLAP